RGSSTLGAKKDVPIIALTAYAMDGDKEAFLKAGMNGYVSKPTTLESLRQALREIVLSRT
ncbi:MAG: response regulator, partial [Candidatus Cloacimonadota bacterium]